MDRFAIDIPLNGTSLQTYNGTFGYAEVALSTSSIQCTPQYTGEQCDTLILPPSITTSFEAQTASETPNQAGTFYVILVPVLVVLACILAGILVIIVVLCVYFRRRSKAFARSSQVVMYTGHDDEHAAEVRIECEELSTDTSCAESVSFILTLLLYSQTSLI